MPLYKTDIQNPYTNYAGGVIPEGVFGVATQWNINRTPLVSRLPKLPVGSPSWKWTSNTYRPRSMALSASYTTGSSTQLTFSDASWLAVGDVLQVESEYFLVTAAHATTPTVTGALAGSSGANHSSGVTAYLIGNTRTGAEVDVVALSRVPVTVEQHCQVIQHAVQIGGALQASTNYVGSDGVTPLDQDSMNATQACLDDFEEASYYGPGLSPAATTDRPIMKGLRTLISTNRTTTPTNAGAYKPSDLVRDTTQKCLDGGGMPDVMLVSGDFHTGFATWGHALQQLPAGTTVFGTPIKLFEAPFLSGVVIMPAPLLRSGTVICLTWDEVRMRMRRGLQVIERGRRGDAIERDYIIDGGIELGNEAHHAWVEGITAFAAA